MKEILVNVMYLVLQAPANDYADADAEFNTEKCDINTSIQNELGFFAYLSFYVFTK